LVPAGPWLPRIGPLIRVRAMGVIVRDIVQDLPRQVFHRREVPAPQHAPAQHPEPDLDLVQPTAMLGREMHYMPPAPPRQQRPPLLPRAQLPLLPLRPAAALEGQVAAQLQ